MATSLRRTRYSSLRLLSFFPICNPHCSLSRHLPQRRILPLFEGYSTNARRRCFCTAVSDEGKKVENYENRFGSKVGEFKRKLKIAGLKGGADEGLGRVGQSLSMMGWVEHFDLRINDGSCLSNLQCVMNPDAEGYDQVESGSILTGASISVQGTPVASQGTKQSVELKVDKLIVVVVGKCDSSYPIQKKRVCREFLRTKTHLRPRTNTFGSVARVRNTLAYATHKFFQESGFGCVASPFITASNCEGAGEQFCVTTLASLATRVRASYFPLIIRRFSLWSTKKDPDLESALSRNKRWIVNSRLKNIILRCPNQVASIKFLQKKFKTLDLQGEALNWLKKYPCCFHIFLEDDEYYCRLTKPMMALVEEEELVKDTQEPVFADRLAKLLMMSVNQRLNVVKLNELKRSFGFTDDYVIRILPKYSDVFRLVNYSGRKSSMEIELLSWKPELAVSAVEAAAKECGSEPSFSCTLPPTWTKPWERFIEFNATPYISPYQDPGDLVEGSNESEKRSVGLVHELLSLTLWKKLSVVKLSHFKRDFGLPEKLNSMLIKHPGIFYVSNKYQVHTVLLREGYSGSKLIHKDPLVVVKDKFGELMQQGLYEYNHRRYLANLEKKREKGIESVKHLVRKKDRIHDGDDIDEQENHGDRPSGIFDTEERKRFYQILFSDTQ